MKRQNYLLLSFCLLSLSFFAEGTKQIMPDSTVPANFVLHDIGLAHIDYYTWAVTDQPEKRLHIRIGDQNVEQIHMGFKLRTNHPKWGSALNTTVYFRIKDELGNVVMAPTLIPTTSGDGYIETYKQAIEGPEMTAASGGYNALTFTPSLPGDYYIEFNDDATVVGSGFWTMFEYFDLQVVNKIDSFNIDGRVWTNTMYLNTPPDPGMPNFDQPFDTTFYFFHTDSIITSVQFDSLRGLGFAVFCNSYGPTNTGDIVVDRKSKFGKEEEPVYKVFLNYPEAVEFPPTSVTPSILSSSIEGCRPIGYDFFIEVTNNGYVEGYFDLNSTGAFEPGSADVDFLFSVLQGDNVFYWDGLDGLGNPVPDMLTVELVAKFNAGVTHLPMYDVEYNTKGYEILTHAPAGGVQDVYWDDSDVNGTTNTVLPCDGTTAVCHPWDTLFGNEKTVNTYWVTHFDFDTLTFVFYDDCTPVATTDTVIVPKNTPTTIAVQSNDYDPDSHTFTTTLIAGSGPSNGSIVLSGDDIIYTPDVDYIGPDTFYYSICDGGFPPPILCDTGMVVIEVQCDDDALDGLIEGNADPDGDGVDNDCDLDADNDGICDSMEGLDDTDGDGIIDMVDLDSDNDGIPDAIEANGGVPPSNYNPFTGRIDDIDSDGDGLVDVMDGDPTTGYTTSSTCLQPNISTDCDGVMDAYDLDSDNDGIADYVEAGGTDIDNDAKVDAFVDANGDGMHDDYLATALPLPNTDGTGKANYIDADSDGDGIDDNYEGQPSPYVAIGAYTDTDGDGLIDLYDPDSGNQPLVPNNYDGDADADYLDLDSDNDDVLDQIEANDNNMDGVADISASGTDTDGDGIDDNYDNSSADACDPTTIFNPQNSDTDLQPDFRDEDDDNDGILTYDEIVDIDPNNGVPDYFEQAECPEGTTVDGYNTISGNADAVTAENLVTNSANALGASNANHAALDVGSWIIVDLTDTVLSGNTLVFSMAKAGGGGKARMRIEQSIDGTTFSNPSVYISNVTVPTYENYNYIVSANTRYVRVTRTARIAAFESVSYSFDKPICAPDKDNDGVTDVSDVDNDNDGILDTEEGLGDLDGDGIPNHCDLDSDNDGIPDAVEANGGVLPPNMNDQGFYSGSYIKLNDADGDGWASDVDDSEGGTNLPNPDSDLDGISDLQDLDSDNDCLPDGLEANKGVMPVNMDDNGQYPVAYSTVNDADSDGLMDDIDLDEGNVILCNPNSESADFNDYIDTDSDNDGVLDILEGSEPDPILTGIDTDGDGIDNICDIDNGGTPATVPDEDGDGAPDYLDVCKQSIANGDWNSPSTWSDGIVPDCDDCVYINHTLTASSPVYASNLVLTASGSLDMGDNQLNICGSLCNEGSSANFTSTGKVRFFGTATNQELKGDLNICDLQIDNSNGVDVNTGFICISKSLELKEGILDVNLADSFLLKCTSVDQTAYIKGSGNGNLSGEITLERCVQGCAGYISIGAPFDMTLEQFENVYFQGFPGTYYDTLWANTYTYNEAAVGVSDSGYTVPASTTSIITAGTGMVNYNWDVQFPYTIAITGPYNLDPFSFPISYTSTSFGNNHDGFNLISNPYPGTLDWKSSGGWTKVGCCDAIYTFNRCLNQYSSFVSGISVNEGSQYIPAFSSFFVKAHSSGATIDVTRDAIVDTSVALYSSIPLACLKSKLTSGSYSDELAITFGDTASSNGLGSWYGAAKVFTNVPYYPSIYSIQEQPYDSYEMSINMMQEIGQNRVVDVHVNAQFVGNYTLEFSGFETFDNDVCIVLEDTELNASQILSAGSTYSFSVSDTGTFERFKIHFKAPLNVVASNNNCGNTNSSTSYIEAGGMVGDFYVFDQQNNIVSQAENTNWLNLPGLNTGTYTAVFSSSDIACSNVQKTFTISGPSTIQASLQNTSPTDCQSEDGAIEVVSVSGGIAPYTYQWQDGSFGQTLSSISSGTYSLTITDAQNCETIQSISLGSDIEAEPFFILNQTTFGVGENIEFDASLSEGVNNFMWDYGDGNTSNQMNAVHNYSNEGTYLVKLIAQSTSSGCIKEFSRLIQVGNGVVGAEQQNIAQEYLSFLENPTSEQINITFNKRVFNDAFTHIALYASSGKLVYHSQISATNMIIPARALSSGVYYVTLQGVNKIHQRPIVVTK